MIRFFVIIACIINNDTGYCQLTRIPESAAYLGMGAYTSSQVDIFSAIKNQAALSEMKSSSVGILAIRRFLLRELNAYQSMVTINTSSGKFLVLAGYSGQIVYNETLLGIGTALKLGERIQVGIQFNYYSVHQQGYGKSAAPGVELGTIISLSEKCRVGFHAKNPVAGKFGGADKLPAVYSSGLGYEVSEKFSLIFEMIKPEEQEAIIVVGFLYGIDSNIKLKTGISTPIHSPWVSIEYILKRYCVAMGTSFHPQLGFTPALALVLNLKSGRKDILQPKPARDE